MCSWKTKSTIITINRKIYILYFIFHILYFIFQHFPIFVAASEILFVNLQQNPNPGNETDDEEDFLYCFDAYPDDGAGDRADGGAEQAAPLPEDGAGREL
jgi:hypothetical protein